MSNALFYCHRCKGAHFSDDRERCDTLYAEYKALLETSKEDYEQDEFGERDYSGYDEDTSN